MNKSSFKSKTLISEKKCKKNIGILENLAKSDTSLTNIMKVTVYKEDFNEEKKQFFIAPSVFMNSQEHLIYHDSNENTNDGIIEDSIIKNEIPSPQNAELMNYPDSSDLDDE